MSLLPAEWLFRVKAATRDVVSRAGGLVRAGEISGHSKSQVHRWGSPDHPDVIPLPAALMLESETGSALVTRAMAEIAGLRLEAADPAAGDFLTTYARAARAQAELAATVAEAQSDGSVSRNEASAIAERADEVQDAVGELKGAAARASEGQDARIARISLAARRL